ncbi:MAG: MBL fold metallo-hydrolase [Chitinophagaceae bacterium]|nr:MBL fold metallo-hydrolase [Chitinophagaceae bacterium]
MIVEQLYTNCLSEAVYFIASDGEAAVIDPLRDVDVYVKKAEELGVKIKYIFETHFHADFVSGHLELAKQTGAPIVYGPQTDAKFKFHLAEDGEEFSIGKLKIKVLHTPGHTLESTCYLLFDEEGKEHAVFTGDTLFVGDVGRPDLFSGNMTKEELASMMYDSLNNKIKTLQDSTIVYPAHGAGSSCGKNLGKETFSTIGTQKEANYALQEMTREEFIAAITEGLSTPPAYFPINAKINKEGYSAMDEVMSTAMQPLSVEAFKEKVQNGVWILDTRKATEFTQEFVPQSLSIGLEGRFAEWAGSLLPFEQPLVLVTEQGKEEETVTRLARVGFENVQGYLDGGVEAWKSAGEPVDMIIDVEPDELAMDIPHDNNLTVLDVRKETEYEACHVQGAQNAPLDRLMDPMEVALIDDERNIYVHCAGGYRSVIAASILKKHGYHSLRNILGGFGKMKDQKGLKIVKPQNAGA